MTEEASVSNTKQYQCPSTYASKRGSIVFCVKREGHEGNHRGYRKMWNHAGVLVRTQVAESAPAPDADVSSTSRGSDSG